MKILLALFYLTESKQKKSSKGQKCRTKSCNSGTPGQSREFRENPGKSGTVGKSEDAEISLFSFQDGYHKYAAPYSQQ